MSVYIRHRLPRQVDFVESNALLRRFVLQVTLGLGPPTGADGSHAMP